MSSVSHLTESTFFEEIGSATTPVIVDFWAEWCGPCKKIAPILDDIATEHPTSIRVAKVNVDENPTLAMKFNVMSIPTLILFRDGEPQHTIVGAKSKEQLLSDLAPYL